MRISVLMAHYNNSVYLPTAIKSVLAQSHADWELIIVDDASTDGFEDAIAPFRGDERIRIFQNGQNFGCGYTKRKCAAHASGEVLGFLDPDDALAADALQIMAAAHLEYPHCSLIHSTHFICDESLSVSRVADYPRPLPLGVPYLLVGDGRVHSFASFKRKDYERTEGISVRNKKAVDQDLFYKLEEVGDILFIDKPLYYYRIHKNSISNCGRESEAQLAHYAIIEEACLRRIRAVRSAAAIDGPLTSSMRRRYKTKYHKTRIFSSFRKQRWFQLIRSFMAFATTGGGMSNLIQYIRKLPVEGVSLIKRSFIGNYEIKP